MFVVFEGCDGSGKSVQADMLTMLWTEFKDKEPIRVDEPDATNPIGKLLRECLKLGKFPESHAALFLADRMALHYGKILPALQAGRDVISSRSFLSTLVYQQEQWGDGAGLDWMWDMHRMLPTKIDYLVILDVDPAEGMERVAGRSGVKEVYERLDIQTRNRQRYLKLVSDPRILTFLAPNGKVIVQGTTGLDVQSVHAMVMQSLGGIH